MRGALARMHRPSPAMLVAIAAAVIAMGGFAAAAIPGPGGTITGCYKKSNGALRVVDAKKRCGRGERRISFNSKGADGLPGAPGPGGAAGSPGSAGAKGDKGDPGAAGARGDKGDPGDPGAAGAKGDKGDKGDRGDPGKEGPAGPAGADGGPPPAHRHAVGSATFANAKGASETFDIYGFSWGGTKPVSSGAASGKFSYETFSLVKRHDAGSTALFRDTPTNTRQTTVTIELKKAGATYATYVFKDATLAELRHQASGEPNDHPFETVGFAFSPTATPPPGDSPTVASGQTPPTSIGKQQVGTLELTGGGSTDSVIGAVPIYGYGWDLTVPIDSGTGLPSGKSTSGAFEVVKALDSNSKRMLTGAVLGRQYTKATIEIEGFGPITPDYTYELDTVSITRFSQAARGERAGEAALDTFGLDFRRMTQKRGTSSAMFDFFAGTGS